VSAEARCAVPAACDRVLSPRAPPLGEQAASAAPIPGSASESVDARARNTRRELTARSSSGDVVNIGGLSTRTGRVALSRSRGALASSAARRSARSDRHGRSCPCGSNGSGARMRFRAGGDRRVRFRRAHCGPDARSIQQGEGPALAVPSSGGLASTGHGASCRRRGGGSECHRLGGEARASMRVAECGYVHANGQR